MQARQVYAGEVPLKRKDPGIFPSLSGNRDVVAEGLRGQLCLGDRPYRDGACAEVPSAEYKSPRDAELLPAACAAGCNGEGPAQLVSKGAR